MPQTVAIASAAIPSISGRPAPMALHLFEHWPRPDMFLEAIARLHRELSNGMDIHRADRATKYSDHWRNPEERPA